MIRSPFRNSKPILRKCTVCRCDYLQAKPLQRVCGPLCAEKSAELKRLKAAAKREQEERAKTRVRREAIKKHGDWEAELQAVVNKYVKVRDANLPCISCGTLRTVRWEAGHYIAVGANNTIRFEPDNIHKQCHHCNYNQGGNHVKYRIGLELKIGKERVEWLESWHPIKKLSVADIKEQMKYFRALTRQLADKEVA